MKISIVVAVSRNNVIGKGNSLPWSLPADLAHFKKITSGHHVIMGRKTFESIGKPLPNRTNIVITSNKNFKSDGIQVKNSLESALKFAKDAGENEVMIIGGAQIYEQALPLADKMYLTRIDAEFDGNTFFPNLSHNSWQLKEKVSSKADDKNKYDYQFCVYEKN